jgi:hypothetical protein
LHLIFFCVNHLHLRNHQAVTDCSDISTSIIGQLYVTRRPHDAAYQLLRRIGYPTYDSVTDRVSGPGSVLGDSDPGFHGNLSGSAHEAIQSFALCAFLPLESFARLSANAAQVKI